MLHLKLLKFKKFIFGGPNLNKPVRSLTSPGVHLMKSEIWVFFHVDSFIQTLMPQKAFQKMGRSLNFDVINPWKYFLNALIAFLF